MTSEQYALLVVGAHLSDPYQVENRTRDILTRTGMLGVQIFFVLSGFLITTLLLKEKNKTRDINGLPQTFAQKNLLYEFIHQSDAILTGSLISILCFKQHLSFSYLKRNRKYLLIPVVVLMLLFQMNIVAFYSFNSTIVSFLIGIFLLLSLMPGRSWFYRFLNSRPMITIGKLSFSIYIWQQFFTCTDGKFGSFARLPKNLFMIIIASTLSYYYFERGFLKLKKRFQKYPIKTGAVQLIPETETILTASLHEAKEEPLIS